MGKKEKRSKGKNDCNVNSASSPSKNGRFSINDVEPSPDMIVLTEGVTEDVRSSPDRVALTKDDDTSALVHTPSPMPPRVDAQLLGTFAKTMSLSQCLDTYSQLSMDDRSGLLLQSFYCSFNEMVKSILLLHFGVSCSRTIDDTALEIRIKEFEDKDRAAEEEMRQKNNVGKIEIAIIFLGTGLFSESVSFVVDQEQ
ncbi:hypothetical protein P8452_08066 [Trifolium repens]|nr:hypothetical protein P8452_08066 [Trifolium repens]